MENIKFQNAVFPMIKEIKEINSVEELISFMADNKDWVVIAAFNQTADTYVFCLGRV